MRIVADSSCDVTKEMKERLGLTIVPLTITVGEQHYIDDEKLDLDAMLNAIDAYPEAAKSACPSPQAFMDAFKEQGSVFVITLTAALSGTYNSAMIAKDLFIQDHHEKFIHVFDSKGSSVRETMIALKLDELIQKGLNELEIVKQVNEYLENNRFIFQLGSLDTMIKNGRISKLKGFIANALNIRPILFASPTGEAELIENVRTEKKSIQRLVEIVGENCNDFSDKILGISHCEALEKAEQIKREIEKKYNFKEVFIVPMQGLSSLYTNRGGITISF